MWPYKTMIYRSVYATVCYDEVVAEYTDTGDITMCGEQFLEMLDLN